MHRHDAFFRQQVVQKGKDRLLVLTCVFSATDKDHLLVEVQRDDGLGAAAVLFRVRLEGRAVDDGPFRGEVIKLFTLWTAQHGADEQRMPCKLGHHTNVQTMRRISATEKVLNKVVLALHVL